MTFEHEGRHPQALRSSPMANVPAAQGRKRASAARQGPEAPHVRRGAVMTLFTDATDLDHWYVRVARGWLRFPAGVNGWFAAQVVRDLDETRLRPVPVWLAFNTGMPLKRDCKAGPPVR